MSVPPRSSALLVGLLVLNTGCYLELRAGVAGVRGANDASWRPEPVVGAAIGIMFDAAVARVAVGGALEGTSVSIGGVRQMAYAGPLDVRVDLRGGKPFDLNAGARPGWTLAATLPGNEGGGRWAKVNGETVTRRWQSATLFTGVDVWVPLGDSTFMLDFAGGVVAPIAVGQVGITDFFGVGPQARVTISYMQPWAVVLELLKGNGSKLFGGGMTPEELEAFKAKQKQDDAAAAAAAKKKQQDAVNQNQKEQYDRQHFQNCLERQDCK